MPQSPYKLLYNMVIVLGWSSTADCVLIGVVCISKLYYSGIPSADHTIGLGS